MNSKDKVKLIAAIVIFVIAIILIAWNFGLFSGGTPTVNPPPANPDGTQTPGGGARTAPSGS